MSTDGTGQLSTGKSLAANPITETYGMNINKRNIGSYLNSTKMDIYIQKMKYGNMYMQLRKVKQTVSRQVDKQ